MKVKWNFLDRAWFCLSYLFAKIALIWEVRRPKLSFLTFELRYSFTNLINTLHANSLPGVLYYGPDTLETRFGIFRMRRGSQDAAIVSPAFERRDMHHLFQLIDQELDSDQSVGFLDVGANIGQFCVRVSRYAGARALKTWAFEPIPENLELLKVNLSLNSIRPEQVQVFPYALSNADGEATMNFSAAHPGDSSLSFKSKDGGVIHRISLRRADGLLRDLPSTLILKIDVEGHECSVLEGMKEIFTKSDRCWLCIEDIFEAEKIYSQLEAIGFKFELKLTPYNSWWKLDNKLA